MKKFNRKKHRLDPDFYKGLVRASITLCIQGDKRIFIKDKICNKLIKILHEELRKENIINWAYVIMPDHMHFIIEGKDENSNLLKAVKLFKQRSGYYIKNNLHTEWQRSFYDHIHRKEDTLKEHIRYIFENPIRKGIVEDFRKYPFLGSLDFGIDDIV